MVRQVFVGKTRRSGSRGRLVSDGLVARYSADRHMHEGTHMQERASRPRSRDWPRSGTVMRCQASARTGEGASPVSDLMDIVRTLDGARDVTMR